MRTNDPRATSAYLDLVTKIEAIERDLLPAARARYDGADEAWRAKMWSLIQHIERSLSSLAPGDNASKAMYLVGAVKRDLAELVAPVKIISEYNNLVTRRDEMHAKAAHLDRKIDERMAQ